MDQIKENRKTCQQLLESAECSKLKHCFEIIYLEHIVEQVHCGAAHVNGDRVEEEDGVVLGHTEHHMGSVYQK